MSPESSSLRHSACAAAVCRLSVVRMNWSHEKLYTGSSARKVSETRSANACGVSPAASADCCTFCPCSSVPVRKSTSWPSSRLKRAITSHASVVYAWPMCGWPFT